MKCNWEQKSLSDVANVNPQKLRVSELAPDAAVHFVPMAAVAEEFGGIDVAATRELQEVVKGYTQFVADDVLFAKITPCMENGKVAVVPELTHGLGYGSTEFHVVRARGDVRPKWLAYFLSQVSTRREARRNMTGSAGQLRVPRTWLGELQLPVPSLEVQDRVLTTLDEVLSELDAGVEILKRVKLNLKRHRTSLLKAAIDGSLTVDWRVKNASSENGTCVLANVLKARREKWQAEQLARFSAQGKQPPKNWRDKYVEPEGVDIEGLPQLPETWTWVSINQILANPLANGRSVQTREGGFPVLRLTAIRDGQIDLSEVKPGAWSAEEAKAFLVEDDDFLFSRGNGSIALVGRGGVVQTEGAMRVAFPDTMIRMRFLEEYFLTELIPYWWDSRLVRRQIEKSAKTSAGIHKISQDDVREIVIPVPPMEEQMKILEILRNALEANAHAATNMSSLLRKAELLRRSVLTAAFDGSLLHDVHRVSKADSFEELPLSAVR